MPVTVAQHLVHALVLVALPVLVVGVVNRTRARWAGRRGPRLLQTWFDLRRLVAKTPVYSETTGPIFRLAPLVALASLLVTGLVVPLLGPGAAPLSFAYDFVVVLYLWGLGRLALVLGALDTGSAFEGMGASREATLAAMVEPVLVLSLGALATAAGTTSFADLLELGWTTAPDLIIRVACVVALLIVLQVEAGRVPVDDPSTHLELTMLHEVMILDHSGPDLAALQYGAALKLTLGAALVAGLVNPAPTDWTWPALAALNLGLIGAVAVVVGLIESLVARLKLSALPAYLVVAGLAALIALFATRLGGE